MECYSFAIQVLYNAILKLKFEQNMIGLHDLTKQRGTLKSHNLR